MPKRYSRSATMPRAISHPKSTAQPLLVQSITTSSPTPSAISHQSPSDDAFAFTNAYQLACQSSPYSQTSLSSQPSQRSQSPHPLANPLPSAAIPVSPTPLSPTIDARPSSRYSLSPIIPLPEFLAQP